MTQPLISDISDTARWMAVYRVDESARPDALFHDPLAARFADRRGQAIAAATPRATRSGWWWNVRTRLIDDVVADAARNGCDRVLNLAAGFDTRPYRLDLPAGLDWIEADLPAAIAEKQRVLGDQTPRCRLSRETVDLADPPARRAFLAEATDGARDALVITEGLLLYLNAAQVRELTGDLCRSGICGWVTDLVGPAIVRRMMRRMPGLDGAPMRFQPFDGVASFEREGWAVGEITPILKAARRYQRLPRWMRPAACLPDHNPRRPGRSLWSAVVCFQR